MSEPTMSRSLPRQGCKTPLGMPTLDSSEMADEQKLVNSHFDKAASYWEQVYERNDDLQSLFFQKRLRILLELVKRVGLAPEEHVLDVGCGAGQATVALAKRGYVVDAIDSIQVMVDATRDRALRANVECRVKSNLGDVNALGFPDETFALVIALGVLPWLPSMEKPMNELCRVFRPGGYVIISVGNRGALSQFLNPLANPLLRPARQLAKRLWRWPLEALPRARWRLTSIRDCDALLDANRLEKLNGITCGFGPFTFFGHELPHSTGLRMDRLLTPLADWGVPVLRSGGSLYTVLARKKGPPYAEQRSTRSKPGDLR